MFVKQSLPQRRQDRVQKLGQVRWTSFYDLQFPLQYDIRVRNFTPPRSSQRVWFYLNRMDIK